MIKSIKKHSVWIFFIFLAVIGTIFAITAQDNAGKIEISKTATKMITSDPNNNLVYGRQAKVELNVKANPYKTSTTTSGKLDIVLVLDGSGSMSYGPNGKNDKSQPNRLDSAKKAANNFITGLMDSTGNVKMGFVEYGTDVRDTQNLTDDIELAQNFINNKYNATGGTNLQAAIEKANQILKDGKRADAKQIVIILTDGIPTFFNYNGQRYGTGSTDDSVCVERGWIGCSKEMKPSEAAKKELDTLKKDNNTSDVYTITFGNESQAATTLAKINPEQKDP